MNMTLLQLALVLSGTVGVGCANLDSDLDSEVPESVEQDLELASVRSTLTAGDVISEVTRRGSTQALTIVWPWNQLVGDGHPAAHNEATAFEVLEGCNEIAYATLIGEAPQTRDVSAVICANCHQTLNHIAPL